MTRAALILAAALALCSCAQPSRLIDAQKPGAATGAGATLTGPANSAAPSTQHARKITRYFPPATALEPSPAETPKRKAQESPHVEDSARVHTETASAPPPSPEFVIEETETTLGQHQDAAPLLKIAAAASRWSWLRWLGVACILAGIAGWLWSIGHPLGYPVVFLGIAACGVVFLLASESPAWLLTLALPFAFYFLQKIGVIRSTDHAEDFARDRTKEFPP